MSNLRSQMIASRHARVKQALGQGTYAGVVRVESFPYYDTEAMLSTKVENGFFSTALGQSGKTLADTNFPSSSRIPNGQKFKLLGFALRYYFHAVASEVTVQAFHAMLATSSLTFSIQNKAPSLQITLDQLLGAPVLGILKPGAAADNYHQLSEGSYNGEFVLSHPVDMAEDTNFDCKVVHHTAPAAALDTDKLRIIMVGELVRQIG